MVLPDPTLAGPTVSVSVDELSVGSGSVSGDEKMYAVLERVVFPPSL